MSAWLAGAILLSSLAACDSSAKTSLGPTSFVKCDVTAGATPTSFPPEGGKGQLAVTAERECSWSATPGAPWITMPTPASGQGSAAIEFTVVANVDPSARSATLTVNDRAVTIAQQPGVCRYQLSSTSENLPSDGGSATITVTASSAACEWSARSETAWITIREGATGRGNGRVTFDAAPTTGPPRAGTIVIADQSVAVSQGNGCAFGVAPVSHNVGASGGAGTVTVTTGAGCAWTASSQTNWITITSGAGGSGTGTVSFEAAATTGPTRSGTLQVAGHTVTVTQSQGCSYTIAPTSATIGAAGGAGDVSVSTSAGCAWSAASNAPWISISSGTPGNGPGSVRFTAAGTTGPGRTGTMTVAGRTFTVTQGSGCAVTIDPASATFEAAGGRGNVRVTASAGCEWRATSNANWIGIRGGATGSGNGQVEFDVAVNDSSQRTGTLTIGGRSFTVTQSGGTCAYQLGSESANVGSEAGTGSVTVTTAGHCTWTASADPAAPWLRITAAPSGPGPGTVAFAFDANPGAARSATLTIANRPFTVNQSALACSYGVAPPALTIPAAGGSAGVTVTAAASCTWTAGTSTDWLAIAPPGGAGNGSVQVTATANTGPARAGALVVAGTTVTVDQPGGCTYAIDPASQAFEAAGGPGTFTVTAGAGCTWTAVSGNDWITVTSGAAGAGTGPVAFTVAENKDAAPRSGTITAAGQPFTVMQAAAPAGTLRR